jgi:hypothetical protein
MNLVLEQKIAQPFQVCCKGAKQIADTFQLTAMALSNAHGNGLLVYINTCAAGVY